MAVLVTTAMFVGVAKMAYATVSKTVGGNPVRVRCPPPTPILLEEECVNGKTEGLLNLWSQR
jgi:hypothetical protein